MAADKRIPELPLKGTPVPGLMIPVYDPSTDVTYKMDLGQAAGDPLMRIPVWAAGTNYGAGIDVKIIDPATGDYRAFTRTATALPGEAPYISPLDDTAETYYIPWAGTGDPDVTAVEVSVTPITGITSLHVQGALEEIYAAIPEIPAIPDAASEISVTAIPGRTATQVQQALEQINAAIPAIPQFKTVMGQNIVGTGDIPQANHRSIRWVANTAERDAIPAGDRHAGMWILYPAADQVNFPNGVSRQELKQDGTWTSNFQFGNQNMLTSTIGGFAAGSACRVSANYSAAFGSSSKTDAQYSLTAGLNALVASTGTYSVAFGQNTTVNAPHSFVIGSSSSVGASATGSQAFGVFVQANGIGSTAFGNGVRANGAYSFAKGIGGGTVATYVIASGRAAVNISENTSAYTGVGAAADNSVILGGVNNQIQTTALRSVVLGGTGQNATAADTVYVPNLVVSGTLKDAAGNPIGGGGGATYTNEEAVDAVAAALAAGTHTLAAVTYNDTAGTMSIAVEDQRMIRHVADDAALAAIPLNEREIGMWVYVASAYESESGEFLPTRFELQADGTFTTQMNIGAGNTVTGQGAMAFGLLCTATGFNDIAMGALSVASGSYSMAVNGGQALSPYDFAANYATAAGGLSFACGRGHTTGEGAVAGGMSTNGYFAIRAGGRAAVNFSHVDNGSVAGAVADFSAVLGGTNNSTGAAAVRSVVLGGQGVTATAADTVYVPNLVISGTVTGGGLPSADVPIRTITGAASLALSDRGGLVEIDYTGTNNITVPHTDTVPWPVGANILIGCRNTGSGEVVGATGVTIKNKNGAFTVTGDGALATLIHRGNNVWVLGGDTE